MTRVIYVVPCYNEAERLDLTAFGRLVSDKIGLRFVDDGSQDGTRAMLEAFARSLGPGVSVQSLAKNSGKGEAVRQGMLAALAGRPDYVGYTDADLATPPVELARLARIALETRHDAVLGSRVARAGARIDRKPGRHYLGRAFATYASLALGASVYDTQCGAKLFRASSALEQALARPFASRWIFDVELLGRLRYGEVPAGSWLEVPLEAWRDVGGSRLRASSVPGIAKDMALVAHELRRLRRAMS